MKIKTKFFLLNLVVFFVLILILLLSFWAEFESSNLEKTISGGFFLIADVRSNHALLKDMIFDLFVPQMYDLLNDLTYSPRTAVLINIWVEKNHNLKHSINEYLKSTHLKKMLKDPELKDKYNALLNITNNVFNQTDDLEKQILSLQKEGMLGQEKLYFKIQTGNNENKDKFFKQVRITSYYMTYTFESYLNYFILSLKEKTEQLQRTIIIFFTTAIFILIFIVFLVSYLITKNISRNLKIVRNSFETITKGDFSSHFEIKSNDEFKELFLNMNTLFFDLKNNINSVLNLMHRVGISINFNMKSEDIIDIICQSIISETNIDGIFFIQISESENYFQIKKTYGEILQKNDLIDYKIDIKNTFVEKIISSKSPIYIEQVEDNELFISLDLIFENIQSILALPVITFKSITGILFITTLKNNKKINDLDYFKLQTFSEYAGLLIDNYKKYSELLEKKEAEYMALQFQMQPHFLYNIMNNLIGLNRKGEKNVLEQSIFALKDMMRYTTQRDYWTTIKGEFDFIEKYLLLQKIRFGSRLQFKIQCQPNIQNYKIPKLLLQPIVENAVIHGIEPIKTDGYIDVISKLSQLKGKKFLEILINDNGIGFDEKELKNKKNVGLKNVEERIKLIFPKSIYFLKSSKNTGTKFSLKIPYEDLKK